MIYAVLRWVSTLLFPSFCPYCHTYKVEEKNVLCSSCLLRIDPMLPYSLPITEVKKVTVFAVGAYRYPLKKLVTAKYSSLPVASVQMGYLISSLAALKSLEFDYIVPIPLHWTRYAWRGFNQADIIAQTIARIYQKPVLHALKRVRRTQYQATLSVHERAANVQDAFALAIDPALIAKKSILLVDDLFTTGVTVRSAIKVIVRAHPSSINVVVLCRAV